MQPATASTAKTASSAKIVEPSASCVCGVEVSYVYSGLWLHRKRKKHSEWAQRQPAGSDTAGFYLL